MHTISEFFEGQYVKFHRFGEYYIGKVVEVMPYTSEEGAVYEYIVEMNFPTEDFDPLKHTFWLKEDELESLD